MSEVTTSQKNEIEEIEVTELVERIEALEKENCDQKKKIDELEARAEKCELSIDALAGIIDRELR